jgi:hypothetical protein
MATSSGDLLLAAAPGFRFYPTEDELLGFYLRHHLAGTTGPHVHRVIPVVDVYSHHPSHLPSKLISSSKPYNRTCFSSSSN